MKHKLTQLISIILIVTFAWQAECQAGWLRPLAAGEKKSLYEYIETMMDNDRPPAEHEAALAALKAYPDTGLLRVRLRAAVRSVANRRVRGNMERLGIYMRDTNPEFIERYMPLVEPIFLRRLACEYLRLLDRQLKEGRPGAEAKAEELLRLADNIPRSPDTGDTLDFLRGKLRELGMTEKNVYRTNFISGAKAHRLRKDDAAYQLLADTIAASDRGLLSRIREEVGDMGCGYIIEAIGVYMDRADCAVDRNTVKRDRQYLRETITALSGDNSGVKLLDSKLGERVLANRLLHPRWPLRDCAQTPADMRNYPLTRLRSCLYGKEHLFVDSERDVRAVTRLLGAEPPASREEDYISVLIHPGMLERGPVVAGHYCYGLDKGMTIRRVATDADRAEFARALPSRLAADEMRSATIKRVAGVCVDYYERNKRLPSLEDLAVMAGIAAKVPDYTYKEEIIAELKAQGVSLIGAEWDQMRAFCRTMPSAFHCAVAGLNIKADYYLWRGKLCLFIGAGKKQVGKWNNYWARKEKELKKPILMMYLVNNKRRHRMEIHAVFQEGTGVVAREIDSLATIRGEIAGTENLTFTTIEKTLARQQLGRRGKIVSVHDNGYFSANANYYGLADILPNGVADVQNVKIILRDKRKETERPAIEIQMPDGYIERLILNDAFLPLCSGDTEGGHSYIVRNILHKQTELAFGGEGQFPQSRYILDHPEILNEDGSLKRIGKARRKYPTLEAAALAFCQRAGFEEYTPQNFEKATRHPRNSRELLIREDYTLLYDLRNRHDALPRLTKRYSTRDGVYAELFKNAGMQYDPTRIYPAAKIHAVLGHWSNSVAQLKQSNPRLLRAAQRESKRGAFTLQPGSGGKAVEPLIGYLQSIEKSALTEEEARQLRGRMMAGDGAARLELADRIYCIAPQAVMEYLHVSNLYASRRNDYLISVANTAVAGFVARGNLEKWSPDLGINLLDFVKNAVKAELKASKMGYKMDRPHFSKEDFLGDASGDTLEDTMGEDVAEIRKQQMDYTVDLGGTHLLLGVTYFPPVEFFDLDEKEKVARDLAIFLKGHNLEGMLKERGIRRCAVYICGSMSIGGEIARKTTGDFREGSDLNLLFLTDGTNEQNFNLLINLRKLLGGDLSAGHDIEIGDLPVILIGKDGAFDRAVREGNGFIGLIMDNRLGSRAKGLATVEVGSINGYSPRIEEDQRIAITKRLARYVFQATGVSFEYGGRSFEEPPNGILVLAYPEDAPSFLSAGLNAELSRIADTEAKMREGPAIFTAEAPVAEAREKFTRRQARRKLEIETRIKGRQDRIAESSVLRPMAAGEKTDSGPRQIIGKVIEQIGLGLKSATQRPLELGDIIDAIKVCLSVSLLPDQSLNRETIETLPLNRYNADSTKRLAILRLLRDTYAGDLNRYALDLRDINSPAFHLLLDILDTTGTMNTTKLWRHRFELERLKIMAGEKIGAQYRQGRDVTLNIFVPAVNRGHELASVASVVLEAAREVIGEAWQGHFRLKLIGVDIDTRAIEIARAKLTGNFTESDVSGWSFATPREQKRTVARLNRRLKEINRVNARYLVNGQAAPFTIELKAMNALDDEALEYFRDADIVSLNYLFMYLSNSAKLRMISHLTQMKPGSVLLTDITISDLEKYIEQGRCSAEARRLMEESFFWTKDYLIEGQMAVIRRPALVSKSDSEMFLASSVLRPRAAMEKLTVKDKFFPGQFDILENFAEEPLTQVFTFMERDHGGMTVGMAKVDMAAFLTNTFKSKLFKYSYDFGRFKRGKLRHQLISTSCNPTNFKGDILRCSTSRQRCMASLIRFIRVGSVFAWVWQPFNAGTVATRILSSSFSIKTRNCLFSMYTLLSVRNNIVYLHRSQGELQQYEA